MAGDAGADGCIKVGADQRDGVAHAVQHLQALAHAQPGVIGIAHLGQRLDLQAWRLDAGDLERHVGGQASGAGFAHLDAQLGQLEAAVDVALAFARLRHQRFGRHAVVGHQPLVGFGFFNGADVFAFKVFMELGQAGLLIAQLADDSGDAVQLSQLGGTKTAVAEHDLVMQCQRWARVRPHDDGRHHALTAQAVGQLLQASRAE